MAYDKDQRDFELPAGKQPERKSENFLPKYFRTDTNKKFLQSTVDQFINEGAVEKINAFVGRKYAKANRSGDAYLNDFTKDREDYQFEPSVLYENELGNVDFFANYSDFIGQIQSFLKSPLGNHSLLNRQQSYSWTPHIDWDKFSNYREYYWLPMGPAPIGIVGQSKEVISTYTVETVTDDNNTAYLFSPDGLTRNPTLKLFKEQTYRFEINTPGYPISFSLTRDFDDNDPLLGVDQENNSVVYNDGVSRFVYNDAGDLIPTTDEYIENGVIEFTVPVDAPDSFYYISSRDINVSGLINAYFIDENSEIDVDAEIIGKKTYTTGNGTKLSNGMKVYFKGDATPAKYNEGYYYVEGVGNAIRLINENDLEVPAVFTSVEPVPFGETGFDRFPWEDAASFPATKDYITINRASVDRNPWSRYNRWFHKDVIAASAKAVGLEPTFDQDFRAKRPIIEFEAGIKLYNNGTYAKTNVNVVDTWTKDVFSTIEGKGGYLIDNVELTEGMRVLFTADTDPMVQGKIYRVHFHDHGVGDTEKTRQIALIETDDTNPVDGDCVLVLEGEKNKGDMYHYDGNAWYKSQQKTKVNQPPLFDMFDENNISLTDEVEYPNSNFAGNKVFSYAEGTGTVDTELGFALKYQNIANVGDIVFNFDYNQGSFVYQSITLEDTSKQTDIALLRKYDANRNYKNINSWTKTYRETQQYVIREYQNQTNNFDVDVFDNSADLEDLDIKVYVNGVKKFITTDYTLVDSFGLKQVVFNNNLNTSDIVILKCFSNANKNANGFYEIPKNFESNPLNADPDTFTLGEISQHVDTIVDNVRTFEGSFPGSSNLRDLGMVNAYGTKFLQHEGLFNLAAYHMVDKTANLFKAIDFAADEYVKFKNKFIYTAESLGYDGETRKHVDLIMQEITKNKTVSFPFFSSDMIPFNASTTTLHEIEYTGSAYFALKNSYSLDTISNKSVLVYRNGNQLTHNVDYVFEDQFVNVKLDLQIGDEIEVVEYENTNGSYVPPTPSKLGIMPLYIPEIYLDDTYNSGVIKMIRGHDGSQTKAYNDYRDDLLLELELRIYNNTKNLYDPEKFDYHDFKPNQTNKELRKAYPTNAFLTDFSKWLERAGNPDYSSHTFWDSDNPFTYNYSATTDFEGDPLNGYWRGIYLYYYGTDRPHTHPWEMLEFTNKPSWWDDEYGAAPYTSNNTVMWTDIREGAVREPGKALRIDKRFARPWLTNKIPVDESGSLLDPLAAGLATNFSLPATRSSFVFGDFSPVETAWRKSSEYRFTVLKSFVTRAPSKVIGACFDLSRMKKDLAGNLVYSPTNKRLKLSDIVFPSLSSDDTETVLTSGLVNFIANYVKFNKKASYETYKTQLQNLNNKLHFRLGGFGDKSKLKLVLDSRSPLNKSSVFVPDENYKIILNKSSVQDTPSLSGIIIEKIETGYIVKGYDKESPYFTIYQSKITQSDTSITVGGISEEYVEWNENKTYAIGSIVFYNGKYYRATTTHESGTSFDSSKFAALADLPIKGGQSALLRKNFDTEQEVTVPYGTIYKTVQDVVDFLLGYESYLTNQGFVFRNVNSDTGQVEDMKLIAKEFLFWVTQNWKEGTVLAVSPVANNCTFSRPYFTVDNLFDPFYDYNILSGSGDALDPNYTNIYRDKDIDFSISAIGYDGGVYLIKLPLVQVEHVVILDNTTVFNDVIYDKTSGVRQDRIKVVGYRTEGWTGNLSIPGFIYDEAKITQWTPYTDYIVGDVVKYKEYYYSAFKNHSSKELFNDDNWRRLPEKPVSQLYPNWDYKTNQFADFYDLDTDNFDSEQQRLAQHLIGYQPRQYLANIITDSVSQYKFYQGMIQEKGSQNSLTKLFDALGAADKDSVEFYEEWALRLGQYGAIDNIIETEYRLDEKQYRLEPQIVELVQNKNISRTDLVYEITQSEVYKSNVNYDHTVLPIKNENDTYTYNSGYVRNDQVSYVIDAWSSIFELSVFDLRINENIWITNYLNEWKTYKYTNTDLNVYEAVETEYNDEVATLLRCEQQIRDLEVGDYIGITSNFQTLNCFAKIVDIDVDEMTVVTAETQDLEYEDDESSVFDPSITISKFVERRFTDVDDLNANIKNVDKNAADLVWLDDDGTTNWSVLENVPVFSLQKEYGNEINADQMFNVFDVNSANTVAVFANSNTEKMHIFRRTSQLFDFANTDEFVPSATLHDLHSAYGTSIAISPDSKTIAVGAPLASNAQSRYMGDFDITASYAIGDVVSDRGTLWRAVNEVNGDGSTIDSNSQDWERQYVLKAETGPVDSSYGEQGAVYIYERNDETLEYVLSFIMLSPEPVANANFGAKLQLCNTTYGSTKLFVSAPGDDVGKIFFFEKIDEWKWTRNEAYKGVYNAANRYRTGDIVWYANALYEATQNHEPASPYDPTDSRWIAAETIEHTGYVPNVGQELDGQLTGGQTFFGLQFAVNKLGDKMVVQSTVGDDNVVKVYNQLDGRWKYLQTLSSSEVRAGFGYSIDISDDGETIVVGDPLSDDVDNIDNGHVFVYQQGTNNLYTLSQTISSPFDEKNQQFGFKVSLNNNKLAVVGKNSDLEELTTFDLNDDDIVTTFDNNTTRWSNKIVDNGRIFLYQEINNKYTFGEDIDYSRNLYNYPLDNVKLNDNHIYFTFPNYIPTVNNRPEVEKENETKYALATNPGLFVDISSTKGATPWIAKESQNFRPDISKLEKIFIYNIDTQDIVQTLDWIDPRQGKIAAVAEQEIEYKTPYDPAVYSDNETDGESVVVDSSSNWTEKHVGQVWWNTAKASWYDPYQGDSNYRTSIFNKLVPSFQIQVCEWVMSDLLPNEWNALSGTSDGYARGVSGEALYNAYSTKRVYNSVSKTFSNKYFYWVRNSEIIPTVNNRQLSTRGIASLIADPETAGYRFVAFLGNDRYALYNCKNLIEGTNSVLHIRSKKDETLTTNVHSEYQMLSQGLDISMPNSDIEQKWHDSLIGYDIDANAVPDPSLKESQKYGVLNLPRQSIFINRIEAVKQFVERVNSVFAENQIVDNYNLSNLLKKDEIPVLAEGKYDTTVDTLTELQFVGVGKKETAVIELTVEYGVITQARIINSGRGYAVAPRIEVEDGYGTGAIINATINNLGKITSLDIRNGGTNYSPDAKVKVRAYSVLVKSDSSVGGIWSIYEYNRELSEWQRTINQQYDTTAYWYYTDWYATGYTENTEINFVIDQSYELYALEDNIGDIVKINTIGTGGWLLLKKIDTQDTEDYTVNYETIGRQNGTIQLSRQLYLYSTDSSGYDVTVYDISFYDKEPVYEMRNIINAIKNDIFVADLTVEYNELFFAGLRYAFNEQSNVDWAFKTSFVRAKHNVGDLSQKITYQNDNLENYQDYIDEVKPYKTKIREYISAYTRVEPTNSLITDFDLPPSYIDGKITPSFASFVNGEIVDIDPKYYNYPFKSWVDNNGYEVIRIDIADGGAGYKATPEVIVSGDNGTTAQAFVSKGSVKAIEITSTGGKYYSAPTVTIVGEHDRLAKAVAILGNSNVRSAHMVVKFDRVSGKRFVETIDVTETFTASGSKETFTLKWPLNLRTDSYAVYVDGDKKLSNTFSVENALDTNATYTRYLGKVNFVDAPALDSVVTVTYKKDVSMLQAADRIFEEYSPTTGMPGINENNSLSSLMKGVEYEGPIYDSIDFGSEQGFGVTGFGEVPWDTMINVYEDEIIELDGSTNRVYASKPFELNVTYNIYFNGTRIDKRYDVDGSTVLNPADAIYEPLVGDGIIDYLDIDEEVLQTQAGDIIIIRKAGSDGSYTPIATAYDTALGGGAFTNGGNTTALGVLADEMIVDGDDFISPTNSAGPEELVPGAIHETLDMTIYHRTTDGIGEIGVVNYTTNDYQTSYELPAQPATFDNIIVILDGAIIDSTLYSVDYPNNTLMFEDSSSRANAKLCIITMGVNGSDIIDSNVVEYLGDSTNSIKTLAKFDDAKTIIVVLDGFILENNVDYSISNNVGKAQIDLIRDINIGSKIQYTVYDSEIKSYSQIIVDKSFNADSSQTNYHKFTGNVPVPFNDLPIAPRIIVKSGDKILSPGYSRQYIASTRRTYQVDGWQFDNVRLIPSVDLMVFVDNVQLANDLWLWDPVQEQIRILRNDIALPGSIIDIYILTNAEYYTVDTKITIEDTGVDLTDIVLPNQEIRFKSNNTSTFYTLNVEEVTPTTLIVQSRNNQLLDEFLADEEFIVDVLETDSTLVTVQNIEYILSDNITINQDEIRDIEIIQFSNHDINDFKRYTFDVMSTTYSLGTTDGVARRNLLTHGLIKLDGEIIGNNYVWVFQNGEFLSPNKDYIVDERFGAVRLKELPLEDDRIDILQFSNNVATKEIGYRIFRDITGRTHYKRINDRNSYELEEDLYYYDTRIVLTDASNIMDPDPLRNLPGIIWIDGERIEFFNKSGNILTQLRRGTLGTGIPEFHAAGSYVLGQGPDETIQYNDTITTHTTKADGSSQIVDMEFTVDNINQVEVFVGGRRLRKNAISKFNPALDQDSPAGDETIAAEFTLNNGIIDLTTIPATGVEIKVVKKTGRVWTEDGVGLEESERPIGKFLQEATIKLPR